ncbi:MAG: glycosyltransferase N-terminal domain-containing protein [bacterium]|nr:glycosyltransferase N-terminal domain-containing protein [bacterium]
MLRKIGYISYLISTQAYFFLVRLISPFNARAKLLCDGQKNILQTIKAGELNQHKKTIWFHVSSLGEFEQGQPVMEALKAQYPDHRLVLTFFSPSGYEAKKNDPIANAVYYLPFESKSNAQQLISILNPSMAFWVKYEFWFQYLYQLNKNNIPVYLLAAQFRPNQIFFKPYAYFHAHILRLFNFIFCQTHLSETLLEKIGITQHLFTGDNRYDRVIQNTKNFQEIQHIQAFQNNQITLIAGSSYVIEEQMIAHAFNQQNIPFKCIIAPHFVGEERIYEIQKLFGNYAIRYSKINEQTIIEDYQVLIIDQIGLLSKLYKYGQLAFIGGGYWENGLHNSLEAAAFGMPLAFGPKLRRFPEAQDLVEMGFGTTIQNKEEFNNWLSTYLTNEQSRLSIAKSCQEFVQSNKGATQKVMQKITS